MRCGIQNPAASASVRPSGTGKAPSAKVRHSSANEPLPPMNGVTHMTWSPTASRSTPSPSAVTTPVASCPEVNGSGGVSG